MPGEEGLIGFVNDVLDLWPAVPRARFEFLYTRSYDGVGVFLPFAEAKTGL
jgi:hypothetical protein